MMQEKQKQEAHIDILSTLSHEFRTPLAIIDSSLRLMRQRVEKDLHNGDEELEEYLKKHMEKMERATRKMTTLMDRAIYFSPTDVGLADFYPAEMNLRGLLAELCNHQELLNDKISFNINTEELPEKFYGDQEILDHIFTNIFSNACKYSPGGGVIEVRGRIENEMVVIEIADSGIGISKNEHERLFDKFFRGSNVKDIPGSGLGLYISKRLVEYHGGTIASACNPGGGTTFTVILPLRREDTSPARNSTDERVDAFNSHPHTG